MSDTSIIPSFITDASEELMGYNSQGQPTVLQSLPLNFIWWADAKTAKALAVRYGATAVPMPPYYPAVWRRVMFSPAGMWYLFFPDGTIINAGILADYFRRNPEAEHPGVADKYVKEYIAAAEAGK